MTTEPQAAAVTRRSLMCEPLQGHALYEPAVFTPAGRAELATRFGDLNAVAPEESPRFACNALVVGKRVVLNSGCPETARALAERGYEAIGTPTDEFIKAGGSVKGLTLILDALPPAAGVGGLVPARSTGARSEV